MTRLKNFTRKLVHTMPGNTQTHLLRNRHWIEQSDSLGHAIQEHADCATGFLMYNSMVQFMLKSTKVYPINYMSHVMRKPPVCKCENKGANQLPYQRLCFRYLESLYFLNPKFSSVAVKPSLCKTWSETPKTGFLKARLACTLNKNKHCSLFSLVQTCHTDISITFEPRHEKTNYLVSDLVRHKSGCTATEDG